jgi:hypothetical protein
LLAFLGLSFALASPLRAGLVLWLPLDDGAGAVATDATGHTGGFSSGGGNTWLGTGAFGGSLQLAAGGSLLARTGGSSSATIAYLNTLTANKISISFWAQPNQESQGSHLIYASDSAGSAGNRLFGLHLEWTDGNIYWDHTWGDGTNQRVSGAGGTVADALHHYVLTFNGDNGSMQIYRDNSPLYSATQATQAGGGWASLRNWEIGASSFTSFYGGGQIDDFAVFDHVLSPAEIQVAFTQGVAGLVPEPGSAALLLVGLVGLRFCRRE